MVAVDLLEAPDGRFGAAEETGREMNGAIARGHAGLQGVGLPATAAAAPHAEPDPPAVAVLAAHLRLRFARLAARLHRALLAHGEHDGLPGRDPHRKVPPAVLEVDAEEALE